MDLSPRGPAQIIFTFGVMPVVLAFLVTPGGLVCNKKHNHHSCSHNHSDYNQESNYISNYKEKRNLLRKLADTNQNKILGNRERINMYKMCGVDDEKAGYVLNIEDLERGIENYLKSD